MTVGFASRLITYMLLLFFMIGFVCVGSGFGLRNLDISIHVQGIVTGELWKHSDCAVF